MKKKELKKKYKNLKKEYDCLYCELIRLKIDDERIKTMSDEQILSARNIILNCVGNVSNAIKEISH